jgi:hypothetical protein
MKGSEAVETANTLGDAQAENKGGCCDSDP